MDVISLLSLLHDLYHLFYDLFTILPRERQHFPKLFAVLAQPIAASHPVSIVSNTFKANDPQADLSNSSPAKTQPSRCLSDTSRELFYTIFAKPQQICLNMCHHPFSRKFHASTQEVSLSHYQTLLYIKDFAFLSSKRRHFHLKCSFVHTFPLQNPSRFLVPFAFHYTNIAEDRGAPLISVQPAQIS